MLDDDTLDVWVIPLDATAPGSLDSRADDLSPTERQRLVRLGLRNPRARHRYLVSHLAARDIVAGYLDCAPGDLTRVRDSQYGKPGYILGWCPGPAVSLSRSDGLALLAVRRPGLEVGVDVERIRPGIDWPRVLGRAHADGVDSASGFRSWTRWEASVKAAGVGISASVGRDLSPWPARAVRLPHPFRDYAAAVATDRRGAGADIRLRQHIVSRSREPRHALLEVAAH
ncbi:hypothetical protein SAVIM338S_05002 [Streptomyces avidinii]